MSGTSLDGVDGVLIDFDSAPGLVMRLRGHRHEPFNAALRADLLALNQSGRDELHRAALAANAVASHYAAPTGTPVRTVGDGVVEFAGQQSGYGNVVQVKHGNERSTLYAHLSRIDVRKGQRVEQGQRLGAVGATGYATGPHLHFEFRIAGQHQDPLRVAKASETLTLAPAQQGEFERVAQLMQTQLEVADTLQGARGRAE